MRSTHDYFYVPYILQMGSWLVMGGSTLVPEFYIYTVLGRQGRQKIIPQKNAEKINKFIKYFVEINKNEVNKNCWQKTKENV